MKLVFPTRSRTGSQFVVALVRSLNTDRTRGNFAAVNGYRTNTREPQNDKGKFRTDFIAGQGLQNLYENNRG